MTQSTFDLELSSDAITGEDNDSAMMRASLNQFRFPPGLLRKKLLDPLKLLYSFPESGNLTKLNQTNKLNIPPGWLRALAHFL